MKQLNKELTLQDRAFSDLICAGWRATDSYRMIFQGTKADTASLHTLASRKTSITEIKAYIEAKKLRNTNESVEVESGAEGTVIRDKDAIRRDLNSLIDKEKDPSKKSKMLLDLAALDQMKKTETLNTEGQQTRYYLPLRCESCSLFRNSRVSGELDRCKSCEILKYINALPEAEKADFLTKTKIYINN